MLVFHVIFKCRPEMRDEFLKMIRTEGIDAACRAEEGNISYEYYLPVDNDRDLLLIEKWRDADAVARHAKQAHMVRMDELKSEYATGMSLEMFKKDP